MWRSNQLLKKVFIKKYNVIVITIFFKKKRKWLKVMKNKKSIRAHHLWFDQIGWKWKILLTNLTNNGPQNYAFAHILSCSLYPIRDTSKHTYIFHFSSLYKLKKGKKEKEKIRCIIFFSFLVISLIPNIYEGNVFFSIFIFLFC